MFLSSSSLDKGAEPTAAATDDCGDNDTCVCGTDDCDDNDTCVCGPNDCGVLVGDNDTCDCGIIVVGDNGDAKDGSDNGDALDNDSSDGDIVDRSDPPLVGDSNDGGPSTDTEDRGVVDSSADTAFLGLGDIFVNPALSGENEADIVGVGAKGDVATGLGRLR